MLLSKGVSKDVNKCSCRLGNFESECEGRDRNTRKAFVSEDAHYGVLSFAVAQWEEMPPAPARPAGGQLAAFLSTPADLLRNNHRAVQVSLATVVSQSLTRRRRRRSTPHRGDLSEASPQVAAARARAIM
ncbi:hypothetical protein EVAR_33541_1 [Eumeta japonica]|uniref:Uncharacterized protein n=1 Tax=Eumeta variegata TaxID=151549 RepID=A0A4C1VK55_EUMVA|nr:hypothetical protein EVAR_33541_1 [Eumeta japonica]